MSELEVEITTAPADEEHTLDRIVVQEQFENAAHAMQRMASHLGMKLVYHEGTYLIYPLPVNMGGAPMALLMDTTTKEAYTFNGDGYFFDLDGLAVVKEDRGVAIEIRMGSIRPRPSDRHRSFVADAHAYVGAPETIVNWEAKPFLADGRLTPIKLHNDQGVPWLINQPEGAPVPYLPDGVLMDNAVANMKLFYPKARDHYLLPAVQEMRRASDRFLSRYTGGSQNSIRWAYENNILGLREIKNLLDPKKPLILARPPEYGPKQQAVYALTPGMDNQPMPYAFNGFRHYDMASGMSIVITPLPWMVIVNIPLRAWKRVELRRAITQLEPLYSGSRKFCDVRVPVMWTGGIDQYLWGVPTSGMSLGRDNVITDTAAYTKKTLSHLSGVGWDDMGGSFRPGDHLSGISLYAWETECQCPWLSGPLNHRYRSPDMLYYPVTMRYRQDVIGIPNVARYQSRNGMNNQSVTRAITKGLKDRVFYGGKQFMEEFPANHQLAMFWHLISRRSPGELLSILGD